MDLYAKAQSLGIQTEYIDGSGHRRVTTPEALTAILAALPPHTPRRIVIDPVVVRGGPAAGAMEALQRQRGARARRGT
jgi:4-alpha-glucanotransferase